MSAQIALSTSPPPALALARSTVCCPAVSNSCSRRRRRHRRSTPSLFFCSYVQLLAPQLQEDMACEPFEVN
ncbi:hypothetical protein GALMADRAFT_244847, partial [Galerina marginata CBS 339.88]